MVHGPRGVPLGVRRAHACGGGAACPCVSRVAGSLRGSRVCAGVATESASARNGPVGVLMLAHDEPLLWRHTPALYHVPRSCARVRSVQTTIPDSAAHGAGRYG
eukprot:7379708-Prymnesium_polylepis.2